MWNLPGNHDLNRNSPNARYANETFKSVFGPTYYSFEYGEVYFVALNNVEYKGAGQRNFDNTDHRGYISEEQLEWLHNDLAHVPKDKLLVIATHIALITNATDVIGQDNVNTVNLAELLRIIKPFQWVYAIAGHDGSDGWKVEVNHTHNWHGYLFIAHTLAQVRGNGWTRGPRDERGVRAATMQDGTPNGYYVISFRGIEVEPRFIPASGNPAEPMRIVLDPLLDGSIDELGHVGLNRGKLLPGAKVVVNLFDGGRTGHGAYLARRRALRRDDERSAERPVHGAPVRALCRHRRRVLEPLPSSHIWEQTLPQDLAPGLHTVRVLAFDEFGGFSEASFSFELE